MQRHINHELECAACGQRLGKHRYGTDQCPNSHWRAGNGQSQWLTSSFRVKGVTVIPWVLTSKDTNR